MSAASESLRVGVVGAGLIAGCHVRAYTKAAGVDVVAVADTRLSKAEQLAADSRHHGGHRPGRGAGTGHRGDQRLHSAIEPRR
jgi:ornithine cyclodeaminase/alanine dehydrogenase-like protein (mu-crystallin family)